MMKLKAIITMFQFIAVFLYLAILLFPTGLAQMTWGFAGAMMREIAIVCRDDTTQWMLVVSLLVYLGIFLFWEFGEKNGSQVKMIPLKAGETASSFSGWSRRGAPILLIALVGLCLGGYVGNYPSSVRSLQILTLLAGMVIGEAFGAWVNFSASGDDITRIRAISCLVAVLAMIVGLLSVAALYQPASGHTYAYHDIRRWTGPWDNPNLFGLLMGAGAVLAAGLGLGRWRIGDGKSQIENQNWKRKFWKHLFILLCLIAVILLGRGLYNSMSRGAWLGTAVGLGYLIFNYAHLTPTLSPRRTGGEGEAISWHSCVSWLKQNQLPVIAIALSVFVVGFWQLQFSKLQPAQRIASMANPNDFSWRNRVSAWQGAIQMMIDKPLTGFGWGEAESIYAKRYCTTAANESAAIQMNDYLMLGISGGVPVMLCFIGYVALVLTGKAQRRITLKLEANETFSNPCSSRGDEAQTSGTSEKMEPPDVGCYNGERAKYETPRSVSTCSILNLPSSFQLITTCRAGAIVLLVGFLFDGGLFKLPTAVVFWTLLELSRLEFVVPRTDSASAEVANERLRVHHDGAHGVKRPTFGNRHNRWLTRVAWLAVIAAVGVSSFYLFAPYLPVSDKTISIARHYLILPKELADFDFLAGKPIWQGQKLKALLDQAELANYNRELVNWHLDEKMYREYALSPVIEPSSILNLPSSNLNWRRPLWESFYPLIRHESSPADAAKIVVQHLREGIAIVATTNAFHGVTAIWQKQKMDEFGFQMICVAALRSVGVPARLNARNKAEFYDGNKWQPIASLGVVGRLPEGTN